MDGSMVAPRAVCIVEDARLRKTLCWTLQAAGVEVDFVDGPGAAQAQPGDLLIIDEESLRSIDLATMMRLWGRKSRVIMVNGSLDDSSVVSLVRDHVDHVVDTRGGLDERGLLVTSAKLLSGDIFGLEKYLARDAGVCSAEILDYQDKRRAVDAVSAYARSMGAGRRVVRQVECVVDELLMNALYDAEALGAGRMASAHATGKPHRAALLRYGADARYLAISVEDRWGALKKEMVVDALTRARAAQGAPRQSGKGGAGLGFYMILACATQVIANIDPGKRTEMVCLFDLHRSRRDASAVSRAFHVFYRKPDGSPGVSSAEQVVLSCSAEPRQEM